MSLHGLQRKMKISLLHRPTRYAPQTLLLFPGVVVSSIVITSLKTVCVWMAIVEGIKTKDKLLGGGIPCDPMWGLCNVDSESSNHLFSECQFGRQIWSSIVPKLMSNFNSITRLLNPSFGLILLWIKVTLIWESLQSYATLHSSGPFGRNVTEGYFVSRVGSRMSFLVRFFILSRLEQFILVLISLFKL